MSKHFADIVNTDFTANMESQLDEIEEGRIWTDVLNDFYNPFKEDLKIAEEKMEKVVIEDEETKSLLIKKIKSALKYQVGLTFSTDQRKQYFEITNKVAVFSIEPR